ncbi:MAG TPA: LytS/YhcK type 5TM receptor domain-containing protein, partial [Thermotogota bacterium]|nr:LytS/YhcK type 5TM receptor domain-containing protein [Thermotogota bacterium]
MAESIIDLTRTLAIVMVAAYGVFHTGISSAIFEGKSSFKYRVIYIMIFGLFSIYGTIGGVKIGEAYSNVRD